MKKRLIVFLISIFLISSVSASSFETFCIRNAPYPHMDIGEVTEAAKFDVVMFDRTSVNDATPSLHEMIHTINPETKVLYYSKPYATKSNADSPDNCVGNTLSRWMDEDRGHSQGSLYGENHNYFFNNGANDCYDDKYRVYLLNFTNEDFVSYASEATLADFVGTSCSGDGVFFDDMTAVSTTLGRSTGGCGKLLSDADWNTAMNNFINTLIEDLAAQGQIAVANRGRLHIPEGYDAWLALDQSGSPPWGSMQEYSFFTEIGGGDVQFFPESRWLTSVTIASDLSHSRAILSNNIGLDVGESGIDNYDEPFSFYDALWYAMGSYLIAKRPSTDTYQTYISISSAGITLDWYEEYNIDIGEPVSDYQITNIGGRNIYWREYDLGYAYVNPTGNDVSGITLPETCKQLNHDNFKNDPSTIADVNSINLISHRGTILLKTETSTSFCGDGTCDTGEDCGETDNAPECNSDCGICSSVNELISHWNFDETSGTIAHDSTGNNNGTINGATWTQGKINGALDFDGANDNIFVDSFSGLDDFKGSVSMWIKPESMGEASKAAIFNMDNSATSGRYGKLYFANTNALKWDVWDGTNFLTRTTNNNIITMNNWNHVVYTFTGTGYTSMKIYINGVEVGYVVGSGTGSPTLNIDELILGSFNSGGLDAFDGIIDDVRIYNYVLSEAKVLDLYNEGASDCSSGADTDGNSMVEISELINYISSWKAGNVLIGELINAIGEWKNGC